MIGTLVESTPMVFENKDFEYRNLSKYHFFLAISGLSRSGRKKIRNFFYELPSSSIKVSLKPSMQKGRLVILFYRQIENRNLCLLLAFWHFRLQDSEATENFDFSFELSSPSERLSTETLLKEL